MKKFLIISAFYASCYACAMIPNPEQDALIKDAEETKATLATNASRLHAAETELTAIKEELSILRADLRADISQLREEIAISKGSMEEKNYSDALFKENIELLTVAIGTIEERLKKTESIEGRLSGFEKTKLASEEEGKRRDESIVLLTNSFEELKKSMETIDEKLKKLETKESAAGPQSLYEEGLELIRTKKDYPKAIEVLRRFLAAFPNHELSDNAQYWLGEAYYAMGDFERAIVELNRVIKDYPQGDKIPSALLKQAYSFEKLGSQKEMEVILEGIIEKHPKSPEAETARERLKGKKK